MRDEIVYRLNLLATDHEADSVIPDVALLAVDEIEALRSLVRSVYRDSWIDDGEQVVACAGLTTLAPRQHAVMYRALANGSSRDV